MQRTWLVLAALVGCGDNLPADSGYVDIIGHHDLGARGMNAALAIADRTVYVGSRIDTAGIAIVDVSEVSAPAIVGEIPGVLGMSSRELRAVADLNLLVVLSLRCDPDLHGCSRTGGEAEALKLYDITDRRAPVLTATYPITGTSINRPRGPHEFYLRRDGDRVVAYVAAPPANPSLELVDLTDKTAPVRLTTWDIRDAGVTVTPGGEDILHSVSVSLDGTRAFLSHQLSGLFVADLTAMPAITLTTPPAGAFDFAPPFTVGPHSATEVPGRDVLVVTEEVYPAPYGTGCPWGKLRTVDIANPAAPVLLGEFGVPENDPAVCATGGFERTAFTAHNVTATHDLAFVTWYAGGLQVLDLADPAAPRGLVDLRPEPLAAVTVEDPALGGNGIEMWSYPIIKAGFVYVVDARNGLYILRYTGIHAEQVLDEELLEGNSNL
ncbi:MAG: hypothetical protein ABI867_36910 [Kofleriaceae bacterium]